MISNQTVVPNKRHSRTTDPNRRRRDQNRQAVRLLAAETKAPPKQ